MVLFRYCENTFNYPVFLVCVFTLDARSTLIRILWCFNAHFANFFKMRRTLNSRSVTRLWSRLWSNIHGGFFATKRHADECLPPLVSILGMISF